MRSFIVATWIGISLSLSTAGAEEPDLGQLLKQPILGERHAVHEITDYCERRFQRMPTTKDAAEWDAIADRLRAEVLEKVVFRGEAANWKNEKTVVEYQDTIAGGPGYTIKKLRFQAVPGMWIPALLYEPEKLEGRVPVILNVNGHDGAGKVAGYKQERCINLAKKGCLALNLEWVGMGQLREPGFAHSKMNQLDLCGTSGLAPFYLSMTRGIDALLAHPNADPKRVAVTGLSGGGWQTIFVSSLDTRVTLSNPVAGYSSFFGKGRHPKDLGDSEQTPTDLGTLVDYTHLTAMRSPRPTLLTYNAGDMCCFEAGYTLPPLLRAAEPIYQLHGVPQNLRTHVNHDPGTHNYHQDNREAFYRAVRDYFFEGKEFDATEVDSKAEVKKAEELAVTLPEDNKSFNGLAKGLAKTLPNNATFPAGKADLEAWQAARREELRSVLRFPEYAVTADPAGATVHGDLTVASWRIRLGHDWTVPVLGLWKEGAKKSVVLLGDAGRSGLAEETDRLLSQGYRVFAIDPIFFGESTPLHPGGDSREPTFKAVYLYALLLATVGDRPLGVQAAQVLATAEWVGKTFDGPVSVATVGPRTSLIGLTAAALSTDTVAGLIATEPMGSLKEVIENDVGVNAAPEQFCFGLLAVADLKQLAAMAAPRPVELRQASPRARTEFAELAKVYSALGVEYDPLKP